MIKAQMVVIAVLIVVKYSTHVVVRGISSKIGCPESPRESAGWKSPRLVDAQ